MIISSISVFYIIIHDKNVMHEENMIHEKSIMREKG